MDFITQYSYTPGRGRGVSDKPSKTVPGEARTMSQILKDYREGKLPEEQRYPYMDVEDVEQINKYFQPGALDLTDLQKLKEQQNKMKSLIDKTIKAKEKAKAEAEEEKRIEELANKKLEEREKKPKEKPSNGGD